MLIEFQRAAIIVRREISDPNFGKDESWFMHRVKTALRQKGLDVVKRLAWKDGNLVDDTMYYLRERKGNWCIYDHRYALRNSAEDFMKLGEVTLLIQGELRVEEKAKGQAAQS